MRAALGRFAGAIGARDGVVKARDRLVDLLTGDSRNPVTVRRNLRDDRHLRLLLRFGMHPSSNFLDVGANRGFFLKGIERVAPLGHHVAYEPLPHLCAELARRFPGVEVRQRALSDHEGDLPFVQVLDKGFQGLSRFAEGGSDGSFPLEGLHTQTITVRTERLDDHVPEGWLPDFVKIDVEGSEMAVLRGAMQTLRKAKPVIAFEHAYHGDVSGELYELLCDEIGLRLFDLDGHGPLDRSQFFEELGSRWNWVADL